MISRNRNNTGMGDTGALQYALSWILWPFLFVGCMSITAYGFSLDHPYLPFVFFNGAYFLLIVSLLWLERVMPHEGAWHKPDGQIFANIAHTLTSKGTSQILLVVNAYIGAGIATGGASGLLGAQIWPFDWPLWAQVMLAVVGSEFMLYWAHRWRL